MMQNKDIGLRVARIERQIREIERELDRRKKSDKAAWAALTMALISIAERLIM